MQSKNTSKWVINITVRPRPIVRILCHIISNFGTGTILHLEALGSHVIVLNSLKDADELLEKRARIYSDRPHIPILKMWVALKLYSIIFDLACCNRMGWDVNVSLLHYNDDWRFHRKICQQNFRQDASHEYLPIQKKKVNELLQGLLETPYELEAHNKRYLFSSPSV